MILKPNSASRRYRKTRRKRSRLPDLKISMAVKRVGKVKIKNRVQSATYSLGSSLRSSTGRSKYRNKNKESTK